MDTPEIEFPRLEIMVATDRNLGIGKNNKMPWRLPAEFAYYRRMTTSSPGSGKVHASIFATKTWQCIPPELKPWGNTICFVLSRSMTAEDVKHYRDVYVHSSLQDIIDHLCLPDIRQRIDRVWMHGGSIGYIETLRSKHFYRLYKTNIYAKYLCDTFFPRYDENRLKLIEDPNVPRGVQHDDTANVDFEVFVYETTGNCPLIED